MPKNFANRKDLISYIYVTAGVTLSALLEMAGRRSVRSVRCRWQAFFITPASSVEEMFCNWRDDVIHYARYRIFSIESCVMIFIA